jgi:hypothetical protein
LRTDQSITFSRFGWNAQAFQWRAVILWVGLIAATGFRCYDGRDRIKSGAKLALQDGVDMSILTLEERVAELESQVNQIRTELHMVKERREKDWRRTIGAFTDDEGVTDILHDALRLREEDRRKARSKESTNRQACS